MDISQTEWNELDDDNDSSSGAGFPEGMPAGRLNDASRAVMGAIKRWYNQSIPKKTDTGGSSTQYTVTYSVAPTSLADGMTFLLAFDKSCGNAPTLNVNSLGAKALYKFSGSAWVAVAAGDIHANQILRVSYDDTSGTFRVLQSLNAVPAGSTLGFRGTSSDVPAGWLIERGNSIGDADSGATELASAACEALFKVLWNNNNYSIQTSAGGSSSRGASADADWTAHKRIVLTSMGDKFRRGATVTPGGTGGSDTHTHTYSNSISVSGTVSGNTGNAFGTTQATNNTGSSQVDTNFHQHSISIGVTSTGTSSGTTDSGSNVPSYVYEISIIKL